MTDASVQVAVGDLVRLEYGKALKAEHRSGGGFSVVGSSGVVGFHRESLADGPALVIGRKGNAGAVHWICEPCWPIDTTYWVRVLRPDLVSLAYLYFWLQTARLKQLGQAGARPGLARDRVHELSLPLPPLQQQRRMVDLLTCADRAQEAARSHAAQLRVLTRTLRAEAMCAVGRKLVPLAEAAEVILGRQRAPQHATGDHLLPYIRAANVKDGYLDLADVLQMNFTPEEQAKYSLRSNDILVSEGCGSLAQIGAAARWGGEIEGVVCFQKTLLRLRAEESITAPAYLHHWARWAFESGAFASVATGSQIFHITGVRAAEMPFPLLALKSQRHIGARLDLADAAAEAAEAHHSELARLKTGLLHALFQGEQAIIGHGYDRFVTPVTGARSAAAVL